MRFLLQELIIGARVVHPEQPGGHEVADDDVDRVVAVRDQHHEHADQRHTPGDPMQPDYPSGRVFGDHEVTHY